METRWLYVTSKEFETLREESKGVCVIPMGCVEKHGLHMPLGTDIIQANGLAYEASKLETFTVFPDFTFGDFPINNPARPAGSITLKLETEMLLLEELCDEIALNGFRKIVVYNRHGGNNAWLNAFSRKLQNKKHDFFFCYMVGKVKAPHGLAEYLEEHGPGSIPELRPEDEEIVTRLHEANMKIGHACMAEAANVLYFAPESMHLDRLGIEDGQNRHYTSYLADAGIRIAAGGWDVDHPNNYNGDDPTELNERIARAAVRLEAERLASVINLIKKDGNLLAWHEKYWI